MFQNLIRPSLVDNDIATVLADWRRFEAGFSPKVCTYVDLYPMG